jgi:hypothetical protein
MRAGYRAATPRALYLKADRLRVNRAAPILNASSAGFDPEPILAWPRPSG